MPCKVLCLRPYPPPICSSKISAYNNKYSLPCHKKSVEKDSDIAATMKPIPFAMRIAIKIRDGHQTQHNAHRDGNPSPKGIVRNHLLQAKKIPRGFGGIGGFAGIGRFLK